jgi:sugar phosphate isomerase/epimerase
MEFSFQLYSARNFQPWNEVLAMVAKAGYRKVEGFGGLYDDPSALRSLLDRNGLSMPSGHFGLDMLEKDFDRALAIAETLGIETMICPHIAAELRPACITGSTLDAKSKDRMNLHPSVPRIVNQRPPQGELGAYW